MAKLSVVMSVYNGASYLMESIDSVINQTFNDFEFIIIDDGSTDNTWEIIKGYKDPRILPFKLNGNHGLAYALNYGIAFAKGEYLARVDADDINEVDRFKVQIDFLEKNTSIDIVDSFISYFPDNSLVEQTSEYHFMKNAHEKNLNFELDVAGYIKKLYWPPYTIHSAILGRMKFFKEFSYNAEFKNLEDFDLFYRMIKKGVQIYKIPKKLVNVRISEKSN